MRRHPQVAVNDIWECPHSKAPNNSQKARGTPMNTLFPPGLLAMDPAAPDVSGEGAAAASAVLYLITVVAAWALTCAIRHLIRVASALMRLLFFMVAVAAFGVVVLTLTAEAILTFGPL